MIFTGARDLIQCCWRLIKTWFQTAFFLSSTLTNQVELKIYIQAEDEKEIFFKKKE